MKRDNIIIAKYRGFVYIRSFLPNISFTPANVITNEATNKSAIANDAKNRLPILRRLRSV